MLVLLFAIHDEAFALPAARVSAVLPLVRIAKVPGGPASLAGVINLHGRPVPVIDLGMVADSRPCSPLYSSRILLIEAPNLDGMKRPVGLLAERVTDMVSCPDCRSESFLVDLPRRPDDDDDERHLLVQWLDTDRLVPPALVSEIDEFLP